MYLKAGLWILFWIFFALPSFAASEDKMHIEEKSDNEEDVLPIQYYLDSSVPWVFKNPQRRGLFISSKHVEPDAVCTSERAGSFISFETAKIPKIIAKHRYRGFLC